jgi:DnaK suppressor protein
VHVLTEHEVASLAEDLRGLRERLHAGLDAARDASKPVDLDEPIGRLSRMDALQQQNMATANRRASQLRLQLVEAAQRRIEEGAYGDCLDCGEPVGFARLEARPESPFCLGCQSRREARTPR